MSKEPIYKLLDYANNMRFVTLRLDQNNTLNQLTLHNWTKTFKKNLILKVRKNQKADWGAVDSFKKRTDEFDLFAVKSKKAIKSNSSVRFL